MVRFVTSKEEVVTVKESGETMTLIREEEVAGRRRSGEKWDAAIDAEYVIVYPSELANSGLSGRAFEVLLQIAAEAKIDTGISRFSPKLVGEALNMTGPNVSAMVIELIKSGHLTRIDRGIVRVNPRFVWRGSRAQRRAVLMSEANR